LAQGRIVLGLKLDIASGQAPKILCLGAHSDDIEIGCAGTLFALTEKFPEMEVRWIVFSGNRRRAAEAGESAEAILSAVKRKAICLESFQDSFFPYEGREIKAYFEKLKSEFDPSLIFTHTRADLHQDHRVINQFTWNTFRNHTILEYEIPKFDGDLGTPNFFVQVSNSHKKRKLEILQKYFGTQKNKHWFDDELFTGLMRIRGMESCSPSGYAEGFFARKTVVDI